MVMAAKKLALALTASVGTLVAVTSPAAAALSAANFAYTLEPGATLAVNAPGLLAGSTDTDGGTLTISQFPTSFPNHGNLTINSDGSFTFTADQNYVGPDSAVYQVCDSNTFNCVEGSISFTITAPVPTAANQSYTVAPGKTLSLPGLTLMKGSTVPNGDVLAAQEVGFNLNVDINSQGGFNYTSEATYVGRDSFSYELCDQLTGLCSTAAVVNVTVGIAPAIRIPSVIRLHAQRKVRRFFALVGKPTPGVAIRGRVPPGLRLVRHEGAVELIGRPTRAARATVHLRLRSSLFPASLRSVRIVVTK